MATQRGLALARLQLQRNSTPALYTGWCSKPHFLQFRPESRVGLPKHITIHRASSRDLCTTSYRLRSSETPPTSSSTPESKQYTFAEISSLATSPDPKKIIIDVREPAELQASGRIPTSQNAPLTSSPDFPFLPAAEFEDRFGFPRPGPNDEVIFYCKSGVRSKAAAKLAQQAGFGGVVSEYPGSWKDWEANGGAKQMDH